MTEPLWWPAWTLGDMHSVHMVCLTCSDPICLAGRPGGRIWTHSPLNKRHRHNALPAPSLISELVELAITERTEES